MWSIEPAYLAGGAIMAIGVAIWVMTGVPAGVLFFILSAMVAAHAVEVIRTRDRKPKIDVVLPPDPRPEPQDTREERLAKMRAAMTSAHPKDN
jgi:hypothetical protein